MIETFRDVIQNTVGYNLNNVSDSVIFLMGIVIILILIVSLFALIVQIFLALKYRKYNKKQNSIGMTGEDVARKILDDNDFNSFWK